MSQSKEPKQPNRAAPGEDDVRVLRPSELEFLKGGAQPGPTAQPEPPSFVEPEGGRRER